LNQTLGSGTPPTGKSPNAGFGHYSTEKEAVGYQYFVEINEKDGSRNVGRGLLLVHFSDQRKRFLPVSGSM